MRTYSLSTIISVVLSLFSFAIICGCSKSKTKDSQDNSTHNKETILEKFFLSIPMDLTKNHASLLLDNYAEDSLIWNVRDYTARANNFEQILAEVFYGNINYSFDTNFIVKLNDSNFNDTNPVVYLIFYNQKLLSLELEIRELEVFGESSIKELSDSIQSMYTNKYGEPSIKNEILETYLLKNINHEIDIDETHMNGEIIRRWKENVKSNLTEWTFLNATIKIITSQYKEYFTLNYKKEKPSEMVWHSIHIFYINNSTVADREQDFKNHTDSINSQKFQKENEERIQDSLNNIRNSNKYKEQEI